MEIAQKLPQFHIMAEDLGEGRCIQLEGCVPSQTEELLTELKQGFEYLVIVARDEMNASEITGNIAVFDREVLLYPALDPMFHKADIQGSYLSEQRLEVIRKIREGQPCTIVTTMEAFQEGIATMEQIRRDTLTIRKKQTFDREVLSEKLVETGYVHENQVTGHGEFSVRGSILDIFPFGSRVPFRIDFFGDEVDEIRIFDPGSQRSVELAQELVIYPGENLQEDEEHTGSFRDYFLDRKTLFVLNEPARIIKNLMGMNPLLSAQDTEYDVLPEDLSEERIRSTLSVMKELTAGPSVILSSFGETLEEIRAYRRIRLNARNIPSYNGRFNDLMEDLKKYREKGYTVILECAGDIRKDRMIRNLMDSDILAGKVEANPRYHIPESEICVRTGQARIGFEYPEIRFALITEVDIFGVRKNRRRKKKYTGDPIREFTDLSPGDYVVHEQHGVGVFLGIERIRVDGIEKDYMKIGYAQNANLYVLVSQFDKIQKYAGSDSAAPKLNRLGGKEWVNTKEKVRSAVQDIARDLVKLYAQRQMQNGFRYSADTVWQREFEDSFEYEETEDQLHAIEDVKADMESGKIMDRLICGDVGFGKTEVAVRAAFKAVQDSRQVAFLTPTTILAQQHYHTLVRRLEHYPVSIRMLSRFASAREQKEILKGMADGTVDIVVGTHRLLSKDVRFHDLGLLVIDEEQRFGVVHKEKIKQLRQNVDVITLSATPIPRTLHMSLTGIRDMSLLTEPPIDRLPIQTYVMEYSEEAVREAITRETARGGQVYYVYNRTSNIDLVADNLSRLLPNLHIAYAHGKMASRELENIMFDFIDGTIDVLVSTTIIETGLDIPNVNTIIIHDADHFGLSQLYQLRGRVGRSNRTSYAFLMYKKDKLIREVAEKRLKAIREFSDLGSGIRIAMRDLEIRGAGNVLGAEQSGHMEAVGYELYCKMLNEAVAALKGESVQEDFETTVDLNVDGYIPSSYITDEWEKLNMYKRIAGITDLEDMEDVRQELFDRFGEIPRATLNLLEVALIKARAHELYVLEIAENKNKTGKEFKITLFNRAPMAEGYQIYDVIRRNEDKLKYNMSKNCFTYFPAGSFSGLEEIRKTLMEFFDILSQIVCTNKSRESQEQIL
ncbi:MAG: transcription-repair coupling factor [Parasporobacterium sp.]|nr:transcription-repair coupling factor [Parasporobacterium sp.]